MLKWIKRLLFGETPNEHFARCPEARSYTDHDGRTFANISLILLRSSGCKHTWVYGPKCTNDFTWSRCSKCGVLAHG